MGRAERHLRAPFLFASLGVVASQRHGFVKSVPCIAATSDADEGRAAINIDVGHIRVQRQRGVVIGERRAPGTRLSARGRPWSSLIDCVAASHGAQDLDANNLAGIDGMGIVRQDHEIGQLAGGDRALDMLFM
jgi:hypothetical protein